MKDVFRKRNAGAVNSCLVLGIIILAIVIVLFLAFYKGSSNEKKPNRNPNESVLLQDQNREVIQSNDNIDFSETDDNNSIEDIKPEDIKQGDTSIDSVVEQPTNDQQNKTIDTSIDNVVNTGDNTVIEEPQNTTDIDSNLEDVQDTTMNNTDNEVIEPTD